MTVTALVYHNQKIFAILAGKKLQLYDLKSKQETLWATQVDILMISRLISEEFAMTSIDVRDEFVIVGDQNGNVNGNFPRNFAEISVYDSKTLFVMNRYDSKMNG